MHSPISPRPRTAGAGPLRRASTAAALAALGSPTKPLPRPLPLLLLALLAGFHSNDVSAQPEDGSAPGPSVATPGSSSFASAPQQQQVRVSYDSGAQCTGDGYEPTCAQAVEGEWALEGRRWNGSALSYAALEGPPQDVRECCDLCFEHPDCVFFDYSTDAQNCRLYDASPLFTPGGGLIDDPDSTASFLDWRSVPSRHWASTGLLTSSEPADLLVLRDDACATNCADDCSCVLWQLDPTSPEQPCVKMLLDGGVATAGDSRAYPTMVPVTGTHSSALAETAGIMFGLPLATNVRRATFEWDGAKEVDRFEYTAKLSDTMPWVGKTPGRINVLSQAAWYSWDIETSLNNSGRRLPLNVDLDGWAALGDSDLDNSTLLGLVFPLIKHNKAGGDGSSGEDSPDVFGAMVGLALEDGFDVEPGGNAEVELEYVSTEVQFSIELQVNFRASCKPGSPTASDGARRRRLQGSLFDSLVTNAEEEEDGGNAAEEGTGDESEQDGGGGGGSEEGEGGGEQEEQQQKEEEERDEGEQGGGSSASPPPAAAEGSLFDSLVTDAEDGEGEGEQGGGSNASPPSAAPAAAPEDGEGNTDNDDGNNVAQGLADLLKEDLEADVDGGDSSPSADSGDGKDDGKDDGDDGGLLAVLAGRVPLARVLQREGLCAPLEGGDEDSGVLRVSGTMRLTVPMRVVKVEVVAPPAGESCPPPDPCAYLSARTFPESRWFRPDGEMDKYIAMESLSLPKTQLPDIMTCCQECASDNDCLFFDYHGPSSVCSFHRVNAVQLTATGSVSPYLQYAPDYSSSFLDFKEVSGVQWQGDPHWSALLSTTQQQRGTPGPGICSSLCAAQCGCMFWSYEEASTQCLMYQPYIVSSGGVNNLRNMSGWVSGTKMGPSLTFTGITATPGWEDAQVNDTTVDQETHTVLNAFGDEASVSEVMLSFEYEWVMEEPLFNAYFQEGVSIPLDGLASLLGLEGDGEGDKGDNNGKVQALALANSSLVLGGPLGGGVSYAGSAVAALSLGGKAVELLGRSHRLLTAEVTRADVTLPFTLLVEVAECVTGAATNFSMQRNPRSFSIAHRLPLQQLLSRDGFCGTLKQQEGAGSEGDDWDSDLALSTLAEVSGVLTLRGLPVLLEDVSEGDGASTLLAGYSFPASGDQQPGQCSYARDHTQCAAMCANSTACAGWSFFLVADPEGSGCGPNACWTKRVLAGSMQSDGVVSGYLPPQDEGDGNDGTKGQCRQLPGVLLTTSSDSAPLLPEQLVGSAGQCCGLCDATPGCHAFVYNLTGVCSLLPAGVKGAAPQQGVVAGLGARSCSRALVVPKGGSVASAWLAAGTPSALSWQQLCCFNGLPTCGPMPTSTPLLLPCGADLGTAQGDEDGQPGVGDQGLPADCRAVVMMSASDGGEDGGQDKCQLLPGVAVTPSAGSLGNVSLDQGGAGACCELCAATPSCGAFTFLGGDSAGSCHLQDGMSSVQARQGAVSGIGRRDGGEAADARRRRRLQETSSSSSNSSSSCPSALTLKEGERLDSLSEEALGGATWQEVCCFNSLDECGEQEETSTLVLPCPGVAPADCAAATDNTIYVYEGSDNTLAIALGVAIGAGVGLLLAGALVGYLAARSRAKKRIRKSAGGGSADGLEAPLLKEGGDFTGGELPAHITSSHVFSDEKYELKRTRVVRQDNSVVLFGKAPMAGGRKVAVKFFAEPQEARREWAFYDSGCAAGHVPELLDSYLPPPDAAGAAASAAAPWPSLVMECGDYSLAQWLSSPKNRAGGRGVSDAARRAILRDLCQGLAAMHGDGIVHRDVKPANLMWFGESHRWKLIDFATWAKAGDLLLPQYTLRYAAPEVVDVAARGRKEIAGAPADMWALGCVLWELYLGEPLFGPEYSDADVKGMLAGDRPMPFEQYKALWNVVADQEVRRLLQQLLSRDPDSRPKSSEVLSSGALRTGMDTVMMRDMGENLHKDITRLESQVDELQQLQQDAVTTGASSSLCVFLQWVELLEPDGVSPVALIPGKDTGAGNRAGSDSEDSGGFFSDADSEEYLSVGDYSDEGSFFSAKAGGSRFGGSRFGSFRSAKSKLSRTPSLASSRGGGGGGLRTPPKSPMLPMQSPPPPLSGAGPRDGPVVLGERHLQHLYDGYLEERYATLEAPLNLASAVTGGREDAVLLLHANACYAIRVRLLTGSGADVGEVPVDDVMQLTVADPDNPGQSLALPCQRLEEGCDAHLWEGFAVWPNHGMPVGRATLQVGLQVRLKGAAATAAASSSARSAEVHINRTVLVELHPQGDPMTASRALPRVVEAWNNAPDWAKLYARGLAAYYGFG